MKEKTTYKRLRNTFVTRSFYQCMILILCSLVAFSAYAKRETHEVTIIIKDHRFIPDIVHVPTGKRIRITVDNQDPTIEEFESISLKREKIIFGKSKARIILAPLKIGEYEIFGDFNQDTAQGKLVVE
jgi:hypothetical protein